MKINKHLCESAEIYLIAQALGIEPDNALGKCVRLWVWAEIHLHNGRSRLLTDSMVDWASQTLGLAAALRSVEWLEFDENEGEEVLFIPK